MLLLEMKRRLYTKYALYSVIGIMIITICLNLIIIKDDGMEIDLNYTLQEESIYEGDIKEENLLTSLIKVRDEKSNEQRYNSQVWIISDLINSYPGILYCENKISDYPDKYAKEFYECWRNKFKYLIKKLASKEEETALLELEKVKTPFKSYPGYYFYYTALDNIQILFTVILFLVIFFASGTYSDSFADESMEIIQSTKKYKKNMLIRILPVLIYGIILSLIATIVTIIMISSAVGCNALKSSFKMISLFSFGNFSIGQSILIMFLSEILGVLALSTLMGYISLKTKKTTVTLGIGVGINIFYMICSRFVTTSNDIVKIILNAVPMAVSNIFQVMGGLSFQFGMWELYVIMIEVFILFVITSVMLVKAIKIKLN